MLLNELTAEAIQNGRTRASSNTCNHISTRGTREEMERPPKNPILQTLVIYKIPTVHNNTDRQGSERLSILPGENPSQTQAMRT